VTIYESALILMSKRPHVYRWYREIVMAVRDPQPDAAKYLQSELTTQAGLARGVGGEIVREAGATWRAATHAERNDVCEQMIGEAVEDAAQVRAARVQEAVA